MSVRDFLKDLDGGLRYLETLVRDHLGSVMDGNQNDPFERYDIETRNSEIKWISDDLQGQKTIY
jgi:hypothetical protein